MRGKRGLRFRRATAEWRVQSRQRRSPRLAGIAAQDEIDAHERESKGGGNWFRAIPFARSKHLGDSGWVVFPRVRGKQRRTGERAVLALEAGTGVDSAPRACGKGDEYCQKLMRRDQCESAVVERRVRRRHAHPLGRGSKTPQTRSGMCLRANASAHDQAAQAASASWPDRASRRPAPCSRRCQSAPANRQS